METLTKKENESEEVRIAKKPDLELIIEEPKRVE
jgi:hypothetical protein